MVEGAVEGGTQLTAETMAGLDPLSAQQLLQEGETWKSLRLNPQAFSTPTKHWKILEHFLKLSTSGAKQTGGRHVRSSEADAPSSRL